MSRHQLIAICNVALLGVVAGILVVVLLPADLLGSPDGPVRSLSERQSWFIHGSLFAMLGLVAGTRLAAPVPAWFTAGWLLVLAVAIVCLATGTELAQTQIEGRQPSLGDWMADLTGALCGVAIAIGFGPGVIARVTGEAGDGER
jgi:VanZ family protein